MKPLTDREIRERYYEILKYPVYVSQLNKYELQAVFEYAEKQRAEQFKLITENGFKSSYEYRQAVRAYEFIKNNLNQKAEPPKPQKEQHKNISFKWIVEPVEESLKELHKLMTDKENGLIEETDFDTFKNIFLGIPVKEITPMKWKNNHINEMVYFYKRLRELKLIQTTGKNADYYQLSDCFHKSNGENPYSKNMKTLNHTEQISKAKAETIDIILKRFVKP